MTAYLQVWQYDFDQVCRPKKIFNMYTTVTVQVK